MERTSAALQIRYYGRFCPVNNDSDEVHERRPVIGPVRMHRPQSWQPSTFWSQSITEPVTTPLRSERRNTTNSAISET